MRQLPAEGARLRGSRHGGSGDGDTPDGATMTERIYYTDPYVREFDARLLDTVSHEGRTALILDRTAFYPASGGQPADAGMFGDVRVLDVIDAEDGRVLHVVDRAPSAT